MLSPLTGPADYKPIPKRQAVRAPSFTEPGSLSDTAERTQGAPSILISSLFRMISSKTYTTGKPYSGDYLEIDMLRRTP